MKSIVLSLSLFLSLVNFAQAANLEKINLCYTSNSNEVLFSTISFATNGTPIQIKFWENKLYGGTIELPENQVWVSLDRNGFLDKYKFSNFESTLFHNSKKIETINAISLNNDTHVKFDEKLYEVKATDGEYAYSLSTGGRDYPLGSQCSN
jgi:hypothetical protein